MTQHTNNTGNGTEATTPASMYLYSKEMAKTFVALNQSTKTMVYVDDMCACIVELEREAGCIYCNDWV